MCLKYQLINGWSPNGFLKLELQFQNPYLAKSKQLKNNRPKTEVFSIVNHFLSFQKFEVAMWWDLWDLIGGMTAKYRIVGAASVSPCRKREDEAERR